MNKRKWNILVIKKSRNTSPSTRSISSTGLSTRRRITLTLPWRARDGPEMKSLKVSTLGLQIFDGGGMAAMTGRFYIFATALRVLKERPAGSEDPLADLLEMRRRLAFTWEGLGEWEG